MKPYIWTYWTKPQNDPENNFLYVFSLILSVEMAKIDASKRIIYTDSLGKKILNQFNLDVEINTLLDDIPKEVQGSMFAYPKMFAISKLQFPAIHIDHDVFIKDNFSARHQDCAIVAEVKENKESESFHGHSLSYYVDCYSELNETPDGVEFFMLNENNKSLYADVETVEAYNCGFLNINNLDVGKKWASQSLQIFHNYLHKPFPYKCNIIPEQAFLYVFSKLNNVKVKPLFDKDFLPQKNYFHLMSKKNEEYLSTMCFLLYRLKKYFPNVFDKIVNVMWTPNFSLTFETIQNYKEDILNSSDLFVHFLIENSYFKDKSQFDFEKISKDIKINVFKNKNINYLNFSLETKQEIYKLISKEEYANLIIPDFLPVCLLVNKLRNKSKSISNIFYSELKKFFNQGDIIFNPEKFKQEKKLTTIDLAKNFAVAMTESAKTGFKKVTLQQHADRMAICNACEFWDGKARMGMGKCNKCGCTGAKQWLASSSCPIGLWSSLP